VHSQFDVRLGLAVQFDARECVDQWVKEGKLIAATRTDIARSGIGVELRAGARKPDISSVEAFKRALLDAKSIAYLRVEGASTYMACSSASGSLRSSCQKSRGRNPTSFPSLSRAGNGAAGVFNRAMKMTNASALTGGFRALPSAHR
jgi:hypothetical protein